MLELIYRTEDIPSEDLLRLFVETQQDREIIEALKAPAPVILVGSRGVGKSFLFRIAEEELIVGFQKHKVLPIYLTFNKSSLIHTSNSKQFTYWMLSRICGRILRGLRKLGYLTSPLPAISLIAGGSIDASGKSKIEDIVEAFEDSWKNPSQEIDTSGLPAIDDFKDAIEEICEQFQIKRFNLFIDEAAHIFRPEQQRQFFTLFRDLRTPYISCNAAVYPGVTSFGETFQPAHDATFINLERNILDHTYVSKMREIVEKQIDASSDLLNSISKNGQNFAVLAFAASGNPRLLLKTVARTPKLTSSQLNETIREYYRTEIWSEHSSLSEKYPGHKELVEWGRKFIESDVLPELQKKNSQYLEADKKTTCFFWIHRDCPQPVKEALRLLSYTSIVSEHAQGIKATRSEIGTRYQVNLGCLFSLETNPSTSAFQIAKDLTPRRMTEYGMNYLFYDELMKAVPDFSEKDISEVLERELQKPVDVLDLANWQKDTLKEIGINKIVDILQATESKLREGYYIGEKRARRMKSAAIASVYEYLSG